MADLLDRLSTKTKEPAAGDLLDRIAGKQQDRGFLGTLASDVAGIPSAIGQTIFHPIDTLKAMGQAQLGEFSKAKEQFGQKHYSEAFGHGLAGLLPLAGPAAAQSGEEFGSGQPGAGAAHAFELLAPSAGRLLPKAAQPGRLLSGPLRTAAEKTYAQVLAPGTKADKFLTRNKLLTPAGRGLLERRVMGLTEKGLKARIERNLETSETALNDAWSRLGPNHQQNLLPILDEIQSRAVKEATQPVGVTQFPTRGLGTRRIINGDLYNAYQNIALKLIDSMGPVADQASSYSLRKFRQILDEQVKASFAGGELKSAERVAQRGATDAIRDVLNRDPSVAAVNREYSFWRSARDVFEHTNLRRVGQKGALNKLASAAGGGAGAVVGGGTGGVRGATEGFFLGRIAAQKLDEVFNSTAWKTVSAVSKNRVAELLAQGKGEQALGVATRAAAYSALREKTEQ